MFDDWPFSFFRIIFRQTSNGPRSEFVEMKTVTSVIKYGDDQARWRVENNIEL